MAILKTQEKQIKVAESESLVDAGTELDILFACQSGCCGTCKVTIEDGMENLTERTLEEKDFPLDPRERLLCQCKIKQGIVKIKIE